MTSTADKDALVRRLRDLAKRIAAADINGFGNECSDIADQLESIALLTAPAEAPVADSSAPLEPELVAIIERGQERAQQVVNETTAALCIYYRLNAPLPQSAPVSREAVIEECAKVADAMDCAMLCGVGHEVGTRIRSLAAHPAEPARECPSCGSTNPRHHPATSIGGEVSLCHNNWHSPTAAEIRAKEAAEPVNEAAGKGAVWIATGEGDGFGLPDAGRRVKFRTTSGSEFFGEFIAATDANPFAKFIREDGHGSYTYKVVTHWRPTAGGKRG